MADAYIVDSGVFVRWYVDQDGFEHARELQQTFLDGNLALETVDFARIEVADVLRRKGYLTGRLSKDTFLAAVRDIDALGVLVHITDTDRLYRAAVLAVDRSINMYDAVFVQAAIERDLPLITSDARLCRAVDSFLPAVLLRGVLAGGS